MHSTQPKKNYNQSELKRIMEMDISMLDSTISQFAKTPMYKNGFKKLAVLMIGVSTGAFDEKDVTNPEFIGKIFRESEVDLKLLENIYNESHIPKEPSVKCNLEVKRMKMFQVLRKEIISIDNNNHYNLYNINYVILDDKEFNRLMDQLSDEDIFLSFNTALEESLKTNSSNEIISDYLFNMTFVFTQILDYNPDASHIDVIFKFFRRFISDNNRMLSLTKGDTRKKLFNLKTLMEMYISRYDFLNRSI